MISKAARNLLTRLTEEDAELDWFSPGGWRVGDHQTSGKLGFELLRFVLVSAVGDQDERHTIFKINDEGRNALADPAYIPEIIKHLKLASK